MSANELNTIPVWRHALALAGLVVAMALLGWRAVELQVRDRDFLQSQGNARFMRTLQIPAHRGAITDRAGEPLAVSTPVDSVWAEPEALLSAPKALRRVARLLDLSATELRARLTRRRNREFVYLKRRVNPELAQRVIALGAPGVSLQREYKRFYPAGEVVAQLVGVTNVDDAGQEGIELAYEDWLRGLAGRKRVIKDRIGQLVRDVEQIEAARPGRDLALTIDRRVQYLAYREMRAAVLANKAHAGSVVVLDVQSGELLALAAYPSFNPNNRSTWWADAMRNRVITDPLEPGSTIKPFTIVSGMEAGSLRVDTRVDTAPGYFRVGALTVRDARNNGVLDAAGVLRQSSNVGAARIALSLRAEELWSTLRRVGFGEPTGSGLPGEAPGRLRSFQNWRPVEQATVAYGYGLSVTPLQLARAYLTLARDGSRIPIHVVREAPKVDPEQAIPRKIARQVRSMLEGVVAEGTGFRAQVPGYRIAGKTGTARQPAPGGYSDDRYTALFAGMAPASQPRLVVLVILDDPRGEIYYGGQVAAPVFSRIMAGTLRLLDVPPDNLPGALEAHAPSAEGRT